MKKFFFSITLCCLFGISSIMAQNGLAEDGWYEYTVSEGNLSQLISDTEKYQITKLRLKGKINGNDLRLIRDMAGLPYEVNSYDYQGEYKTDGKLQYLDFADVKISWTGNCISSNSTQGIFQYSSTLIEVKAEGLTDIGNYMFADCPKLCKVSFPNVVRATNRAFSGCSSLVSAELPMLKEVYPDTFEECISLEDVDLSNAEIIGSEAFRECTSLKAISLPNVTLIRSSAFYDCTSLEKIFAPNLWKVEDAAFSLCEKLKGIEFPNLEILEQSVFYWCKSLSSIELPKVKVINSGAFVGCDSISSVSLPLVEEVGNYAFQGCSLITSISLPQVKIIRERAFCASEKIKHISIDNVEYIGISAFSGCNVENIYLPKVRSIGEQAFEDCKAVVELGENLETIGCYAFWKANVIKINALNVPIISSMSNSSGNQLKEGLSDIGTFIVPAESLYNYRNAENWNTFKERIIPNNAQMHITAEVEAEQSTSGILTSVGEDLLSHITHLTLKGSINGYDIMLMRNKMPNLHHLDLTDVIIEANPYEYYEGFHTEDHRISGYAFADQKKLISIKLPNSITYIGDCAFKNCSLINKLEIPHGVLSIDMQAFESCTSLDSVYISEGVRTLGYSAFSRCENLKYIYLPNSIEVIGNYCFAGCSSLLNISFPSELHTIKYGSFERCSSLIKVVFPEKLKTIDNNAFYNCVKLSEVHLSPMIESIGSGAFGGCRNIELIYNYIANAKDIKIAQNTFDCWTGAALYVPSFSFNTYYWDTQWSQFAYVEEFDDKYESFYSKNTITLDKETGIITGTPDAVLHESGGLIVNDEEKQDLDVINLKSDGTNAATLIPENAGNITAKKVDITIKVKSNKWHFFCFPFDIPLSGVTYEGEYVWRRYDGAKRSRREGGWQNLAAGTTVLEAGRGYIFQGTLDGDLTLSVDNPEITASNVKTGLEVHPSDNSQDASWNFVGNPYVSYYSIDATTYSAPITIWNGTGYEAYRPGDDDYMFHPYEAFFVQTPVDATEIGFDAASRESFEQSQASLAAARARRTNRKMNVNRLLVNLELFVAGDTAYTDKTRIVFNDNENPEYDATTDAVKFLSSERSAEFYTLDSKNVQYAINERPMTSGEVRLGFMANKAGTYSIAQGRSDVQMLLVDHVEDITHDLSAGAYSFSCNDGIYDDRFTLKMARQETGIEELKEKTGIVLTTDGGLVVSGAADDVEVKVYRLNGTCIDSFWGNGSLQLPRGVYIVKIGMLTVKVNI